VPGPCSFKVEIPVAKLRKYKLSSNDKIPAGGEHYDMRSINSLISSAPPLSVFGHCSCIHSALQKEYDIQAYLSKKRLNPQNNKYLITNQNS
jgi:hypothetical protein